jgi:hypothetical protein
MPYNAKLIHSCSFRGFTYKFDTPGGGKPTSCRLDNYSTRAKPNFVLESEYSMAYICHGISDECAVLSIYLGEPLPIWMAPCELGASTPG